MSIRYIRLMRSRAVGRGLIISVALCAGLFTLGVQAAEPAQCEKVRLSDPGWSDIGATNGIVTTLLDGLGYQSLVYMLSVPVGFESLKNGDTDLFMGNWMPAQQAFRDKYQNDIDVLSTNLDGVKFTLAVPSYVYQAGVKDFADLHRFAAEFKQRLYGIAAGSPANQNLQNMIDSNDFALKDWQVVESGEQAMLAEVDRAIRRQQFIVFLAWEPHPMNVKYDIHYLSGGDKYFGANYGGATIHTLTRKGYGEACANVTALLKNLRFDVAMENQIIDAAQSANISPKEAAKAWITTHPQSLSTWLDGVSTYQGEPGLAAVKQALGL